MDEAQVLLLYNTMVLPHLQYCVINWGNSKSPRSHADPLFARLHILKIGDLFDQQLRLFSYKSYYNKLPGEMVALLDKVGDSHSHDTRGARLDTFFPKLLVKVKKVGVYLIRLWP